VPLKADAQFKTKQKTAQPIYIDIFFVEGEEHSSVDGPNKSIHKCYIKNKQTTFPPPCHLPVALKGII